MTGMAGKLFVEKGWESMTSELLNEEPWPKVQHYVNERDFLYSDKAFAEYLLKKASPQNEGVALFLCYLMASARKGHLCVRVGEDLIPNPIDGGLESDRKALSQVILDSLYKIPEGIVCESMDGTYPLRPICKRGDHYYLQRYWVYESLFVKHLKRLAFAPESEAYERALVEPLVRDMEMSGKLLKEQAEAILFASKHALTIVTGGPGTGKTYTAACLMKIFNKAKKSQNLKIILTAPTGKAVENLQMSLSRIFEGATLKADIEGKTLHSLLGINRYRAQSKHGENSPLNADLIILDESSMVDVRLMAQLFSSVKEGAHLLLLGDPHQLPPVEAGSLFADMIALCQKETHYSSLNIHLKTCLRAELKEIIKFSAMIQEGYVHGVLDVLDKSQKNDPIHLLEFEKDKKGLLDLLEERFQALTVQDPLDYLQSFNCYRVLSPIRHAKLGVESINYEMFNRLDADAVPIMIVRNHHRLGLFNGEVGVFFRRGLYKGEAIFPGRGDGQAYFDQTLQVRRFPVQVLPQYEYAYCISVHKSQGSEFDRVMLVLPEGSEIFGREILYTAVTRAKKSLEIVASRAMIKEMISHSPKRISGILSGGV